MAATKKYKAGEICWTDMGTTNTAGAKKFYKGLLGWKLTDNPMPTGGKYTLATVGGKDVCGFYPMSDEQKKMKAPPMWVPYVSVKNLTATIKKAKAAGGTVVSPPMAMGHLGRMAVLLDPTGAAFALWQAGDTQGAGIEGKPGTVCWQDLNTPKPAVSSKFYLKTFGWKTTTMEAGGMKYSMFVLGKMRECGMWPTPIKKLPPSWITYFQVADCAKSVAKAKRLGGKVVMATTHVPEMLKFAVLRDPQGAVFGVLEPQM
jgi:predicted enzyme related to lactoylglutathione lyase